LHTVLGKHNTYLAFDLRDRIALVTHELITYTLRSACAGDCSHAL